MDNVYLFPAFMTLRLLRAPDAERVVKQLIFNNTRLFV